MDITFYDDVKCRIINYDNVVEVQSNSKFTDIKCIESDGSVFRARILSREYNRIEISKE